MGPSTPNLNVPAPAQIRREAFAHFIDERTGPIGRVVGSEREPAGSHVFAIWVSDDAITLDVGHIIVAFSEEAAVIGVIDEARRFSDLRSFLDDYFDRRMEDAIDADLATRRPEMLVFSVRVLATRHLRDDVASHRPPVSGPVWFATREAIDYALGREEFTGTPVPALMHTNGNAERDEFGEEKRNAAGNVSSSVRPSGSIAIICSALRRVMPTGPGNRDWLPRPAMRSSC